MFLKDYSIDADQLIDAGHDAHKLAAMLVEDFGRRVAGVLIRGVDGSCRSGPEGALLADIEARGVPTYCGAGLEDAVAVMQELELDRPLEAASAVLQAATDRPQGSAGTMAEVAEPHHRSSGRLCPLPDTRSR
ncbi:hypothetical protein [uncultured Sphingomonas sp.]|uniref:hypothetical protein n=1 Tax=uncultured Sphingomonas sp. TaxID=158754 RepID=UPI0035CA068B